MSKMMKAVILAAGKGERLRPLTEKKPKAMLPVCNKPLIEYLIDAVKEKVDEIAVVVGYLGEEIMSAMRDLKFYRDTLMEGTATALYAARDFVEDDFILIYGDIFFDFRIDEIIENPNSIGIVRVDDVSRYGKVIYKDGNLVRIVKKGEEGKGYVNAGIYHLDASIFEFIERVERSERGEYELTDALNMYKKLRVVPLEGYWNDIGYPWDYLDANMYMLKKVKYAVGENVEIWENATIRKPVVIGDNCEVKNCVIEHSVIGKECVVGEFSVLKRSVLMNFSKLPHFNYVADSVIAENCNLGAGTKIANLRFDERNVKVTIKGERVDSGRRKLGAFIGYNVKAGINVSIYPGVKIGSDSWIEGGALVKRDVERSSKLLTDQKWCL